MENENMFENYENILDDGKYEFQNPNARYVVCTADDILEMTEEQYQLFKIQLYQDVDQIIDVDNLDFLDSL